MSVTANHSRVGRRRVAGVGTHGLFAAGAESVHAGSRNRTAGSGCRTRGSRRHPDRSRGYAADSVPGWEQRWSARPRRCADRPADPGRPHHGPVERRRSGPRPAGPRETQSIVVSLHTGRAGGRTDVEGSRVAPRAALATGMPAGDAPGVLARAEGRPATQSVDILVGHEGPGEAGVLADLQPETGGFWARRPGEDTRGSLDGHGRLDGQLDGAGCVITFQTLERRWRGCATGSCRRGGN